jgi:hypothetical protein
VVGGTENGSEIVVEETREGRLTIGTDRSKTTQAIEYIAKIELPKKRFCEYCNLEQPYRSKHCRECEKCVRKYDHHCFWIGGCVGELNHRKFYGFLAFQTINFLQCFGIVSTQYNNTLTGP